MKLGFLMWVLFPDWLAAEMHFKSPQQKPPLSSSYKNFRHCRLLDQLVSRNSNCLLSLVLRRQFIYRFLGWIPFVSAIIT